MTLPKATRVACPTCNAAEHAPCRTPRGFAKRDCHSQRGRYLLAKVRYGTLSDE